MPVATLLGDGMQWAAPAHHITFRCCHLRLEHGCKKHAVKYISKTKLESLLENFTAIFDVISYIILQPIIALKAVYVKKGFLEILAWIKRLDILDWGLVH